MRSATFKSETGLKIVFAFSIIRKQKLRKISTFKKFRKPFLISFSGEKYSNKMKI